MLEQYLPKSVTDYLLSFFEDYVSMSFHHESHRDSAGSSSSGGGAEESQPAPDKDYKGPELPEVSKPKPKEEERQVNGSTEHKDEPPTEETTKGKDEPASGETSKDKEEDIAGLSPGPNSNLLKERDAGSAPQTAAEEAPTPGELQYEKPTDSIPHQPEIQLAPRTHPLGPPGSEWKGVPLGEGEQKKLDADEERQLELGSEGTDKVGLQKEQSAPASKGVTAGVKQKMFGKTGEENPGPEVDTNAADTGDKTNPNESTHQRQDTQNSDVEMNKKVTFGNKIKNGIKSAKGSLRIKKSSNN